MLGLQWVNAVTITVRPVSTSLAHELFYLEPFTSMNLNSLVVVKYIVETFDGFWELIKHRIHIMATISLQH